ncbi:ABC transporter ATP-binding protein [Anaerocolumna aminovalerica]|uniref:ATP-binding cassette, subfamily B, MsbA n=1 Tax=Anaerocolumna aminovalerica TaxID=1527 RepID=A0A1I5HLJ7_9FIRM|nr:ABC transporter ATP-binding protein [Anaerocolumna aminovalerica]MDU6263580.1 ABC transporter ATP-binding protein [Anaerocolumna aminovalerica]SFO49188.1 ATP-binding cassette, subfamily B, MsbA [Anaerocolumna aminovalerica]
MSNKDAVKKLVSLLKEYKRIIYFIFGCLIISTGLNLCIPLLSRSIMDYGFIGGDKELLIKLVMISAILPIVNAAIDLLKEKKRIDISAKLEYSLSEKAFQHLIKIKANYFTGKNYTEIFNNLNTDIAYMVSITDGAAFFIVTQVFSITGGIIGLFIINYKMTLLVLIYIPCKYLLMKYLARRRKLYADQYIEDAQKYAKWFGDTVGGVHEIKLFNIADGKKQEFEDKQKKVIIQKKKINLLGVWNASMDTLMIQLLIMVLYILGANLVFDFKLSVGSVFAFITYSTYVTAPISGILNIGYMLSGIIPSTKRYYEFMDLQEEEERGNPLTHPVFGTIKLRDVSFSYVLDKPILKNMYIRFEKGSKTALIGKNGTGKSTIIGLITRMYEPDQGKILLNEEDVLSFALSEYREMISVVSQQVYLFDNTIRNNICLYKKKSEEEIMQAVIDSGLKDFIDEVSLDYSVGQNGSLLSGGQKQKIAMARALLHDKSIIIFDEATSNTDVYSEMQINNLLHSRLKEKTVIVVTHKQEVLKEVDQIILLGTEGLVSGTYEELYNGNQDFSEMVDLLNR